MQTAARDKRQYLSANSTGEGLTEEDSICHECDTGPFEDPIFCNLSGSGGRHLRQFYQGEPMLILDLEVGGLDTRRLRQSG